MMRETLQLAAANGSVAASDPHTQRTTEMQPRAGQPRARTARNHWAMMPR